MRVVDYTTQRTRSIPLTAIDGRPGAGKTAIVRHVMRAANGRVTAVVRDLDRLIANDPDVRRSGPVAVWPNGSMAVETDDPTATLALLARREEPPDHVLVEGVGGARAFGGVVHDPSPRSSNQSCSAGDPVTRARLSVCSCRHAIV